MTNIYDQHNTAFKGRKMTTKHTQGPWILHNNIEVFGGTKESHFEVKISFNEWKPDYSNFEEAEANARLITAAPELLEALKYIVNCADPGEDAELTVDGYNKACAAIAKAEGDV